MVRIGPQRPRKKKELRNGKININLESLKMLDSHLEIQGGLTITGLYKSKPSPNPLTDL